MRDRGHPNDAFLNVFSHRSYSRTGTIQDGATVVDPVIVRVAHPDPGELGDETQTTVAVARSLAHTLRILYDILDHSLDRAEVSNFENILKALSQGMDDLAFLLEGRQHVRHLAKLYPRSGVEFEGAKYTCYSKAVAKHAGGVWQFLSFFVVNQPGIKEYNTVTLTYSDQTPVIDAETIHENRHQVKESLEILRVDQESLKVLLENEHLDICERIREIAGKPPITPLFIPTELQTKILKALKGKGLGVEQLAREVDVNDRQFYGKDGKEGPLAELVRYRLIEKRGNNIGYISTAFPPDGTVII